MLEVAKVKETNVGTRTRVLTARILVAGAEGDDENAEEFDDAEVLSPLGLDVRPVPTSQLQALIIRDGDDALIISMRDKSRTKLTDLEVGETRLSGAKEETARIRIRANGDIEITAKSGSNVIVNGGTKEVARKDDAVNCGTLTATVPSGSGTVPVTFIYTDANGVPSLPSTSAVMTGGKITAGAANFKG